MMQAPLARPLGLLGKTLLTVWLLAFGAAALGTVVVLWPGAPPADDPLQALRPSLLPDVQTILLATAAGGLGAWIQLTTSFASFAGNRRLTTSWVWWYLHRPFVGMALATIAYLALRALLQAAGSDDALTGPFTVAALGGVVGLVSRQATDKVGDTVDAAFRSATSSERADTLENPKPAIVDVFPSALDRSRPPEQLRIAGRGFVPESVVRVGGVERETDFDSSGRLRVRLAAEDLDRPGQLAITVESPEPGGGVSQPVTAVVL